MKKFHLIVILLIVLLALAYFIFITDTPITSTEQQNRVELNYRNDIENEREEMSANDDTASTQTSTVVQLSGLNFSPPSGWIETNYLSGYQEKYGGDKDDYGITFESPDLTTHTVRSGMGNIPTEGIRTGARLGVGLEPANVADSIADAQKYAEFQLDLLEDSSNALEGKIISMAGQPAVFLHHESVENAAGGFASVGLYNKNQIIKVNLTYGVDESFETYRQLFDEVVSSVQLN